MFFNLIEQDNTIMSFFSTFSACFLAIILFWTVIRCLELHVPFTALFKNRRYYYLSFIHGKIVEMQYERKKQEDILAEIKKLNFHFMAFPGKKQQDDINYIKALVNQDDIVIRYLFQKDFSYSSFIILDEEFGSSKELKERIALSALSTITSIPDNRYVEKLCDLLVELLTPPFMGSEENAKLSKGENESNVYYAALRTKAIKENCSIEKFVKTMLILHNAYEGTEIVKGKQGVNHHSNKIVNSTLSDLLDNKYRSILET